MRILQSGLTIKTLNLPSGILLEYAERGTPAGAPLVFLHGVTDSWRSFQGVLRCLPAETHAFAVSLRGHGNSSRPAAGYGYQDMAEDLHAFLQTLGIPAAVVAGHSMGAMVARQFACNYPAQTAGLVLMGGWATLKGHPLVRQFFASSIAKLKDPIDPAFVREFQLSTLARGIPPAFLETAIAESLKAPARVWRAAFEGFLTSDCGGGASMISVPTLIAWGERDAYVDASDRDALMKAMPGSRFITYRGAGHAFHWEDPASFVRDLTSFLLQIN